MSAEEANVTNTPSGGDDFDRYQRELALVDQVIGLQAALAEESARNSPSRIHVDELEDELSALKRSATWRVGRALLAPLRVARARFSPPPKW
jgi:hypothetical protein